LREEITGAKEVKNNEAKIMGVEIVEIVKVVEVGEVSLKHEWMGNGNGYRRMREE